MLHHHDLYRHCLLLIRNDVEGVRPSAGLRPAAEGDLPEIERLLAAESLPLEGVANSLNDFVVAERNGTVVAAGGLEVAGDDALLRSVVVAEGSKGEGVGLALTTALLTAARERGLRTVWLLTETAPRFFERFGFRTVDRAAAPEALAQTAEFRHCCATSTTAMARRVGPLRILVLCTANSARSQMAEALLRDAGGDLVEVASAGTIPADGPHPEAIAALQRRGIEWQGKRSKSIEETGENWDLVITVCDGARDNCPVLPGRVTVHWGLVDPSDAEKLAEAFDAATYALDQRIRGLISLPWATMQLEEIAEAAAGIHRAG